MGLFDISIQRGFIRASHRVLYSRLAPPQPINPVEGQPDFAAIDPWVDLCGTKGVPRITMGLGPKPSLYLPIAWIDLEDIEQRMPEGRFWIVFCSLTQGPLRDTPRVKVHTPGLVIYNKRKRDPEGYRDNSTYDIEFEVQQR